jgi:hypothetical protein
MNDATKALIIKIKSKPSEIEFNEVIDVINNNYTYQACEFKNGELTNAKQTNEGSCKVFSFAQLNLLSEQETLACFGQYYRDDVVKNPNGDDHGNIRNFMKTGWEGIHFPHSALQLK